MYDEWKGEFGEAWRHHMTQTWILMLFYCSAPALSNSEEKIIVIP
jgi:hypothetical protein